MTLRPPGVTSSACSSFCLSRRVFGGVILHSLTSDGKPRLLPGRPAPGAADLEAAAVGRAVLVDRAAAAAAHLSREGDADRPPARAGVGPRPQEGATPGLDHGQAQALHALGLVPTQVDVMERPDSTTPTVRDPTTRA